MICDLMKTFQTTLRSSLAAELLLINTEKSVTLPVILSADINIGVRSDFVTGTAIYIEPVDTEENPKLRQWTTRHGGRKHEQSFMGFTVEYRADKTDEDLVLFIGYVLHGIERVLEKNFPAQNSRAPYFLAAVGIDFTPTLAVDDPKRESKRGRFRKAGTLLVDVREERGIGNDA
ncbi:MAG: hypothetical protein NUV56_00570 [Candidatus Uhrbacteria bacterium]|nr:hypothetical protein [Candidatus Uhrbacteria bacterium]